MIAEFVIFAVVGIVTGTMAGLFGVGGGLIIVPVMHFIMTSYGLEESLAMPLSIGTALACIIVTSSSAAYSHYQKGSLSVKRFSQLTVGMLVGAGFGASFVINVDTEILKIMLAIFVSIMAFRLFIDIKMPKVRKEPNFLFFNFSGGLIGYVSSIFGIVGKKGRSLYSTTKSGLLGLTKSSALDLAKHNILVNTVSPGVINVGLTKKVLNTVEEKKIKKEIPLNKLGKASDVSNLVCFLCSDLNNYITGQNFVVDGGYISK